MATTKQNEAMAKAVALMLNSFGDGINQLVAQAHELNDDIVSNLTELSDGVSGDSMSMYEVEESLLELMHSVNTFSVGMTKGLKEQEAFLKPLRMMQGESSEERAQRITKKKERTAKKKAERAARKAERAAAKEKQS